MLQVVEIGSQLTVFFGSILLIIAAIILTVVVVRFKKERNDYNGDGKGEVKNKGNKDIASLSDVGNSDAGNTDAGNSGAGTVRSNMNKIIKLNVENLFFKKC